EFGGKEKGKVKIEKNISLQVASSITIEDEATIKDLQEQLTLLTMNFNKTFKKLLRNSK
ncbi:hypothetical protein Golax_021580, partial [Gossypium laxum]|nr:hypothetical protein [Gossypium laxum]